MRAAQRLEAGIAGPCQPAEACVCVQGGPAELDSTVERVGEEEVVEVGEGFDVEVWGGVRGGDGVGSLKTGVGAELGRGRGLGEGVSEARVRFSAAACWGADPGEGGADVFVVSVVVLEEAEGLRGDVLGGLVCQYRSACLGLAWAGTR